MNAFATVAVGLFAGLIGLAPAIVVDTRIGSGSPHWRFAEHRSSQPTTDPIAELRQSAKVLSTPEGRVGAESRQGADVHPSVDATSKIDVKPLSISAVVAEKPSRLRMSDVEKIRLRVFGVAELNGEYVIDEDASLSIPGLKRMAVGELSPVQLEAVLSEQLTAGQHRDVKASIEIARYRSYYITGMIGQAGAFEWHPDLNVLRAISLAGGVTRATEPSSAQTAIRAATAHHAPKTVLKRLVAERDALSAASQQPLDEQAEPGARAIAPDADEDAIKFAGKLHNLSSARRTALLELDVATRESDALGKQVGQLQAAIQDLESMRAKNLISNHGYLVQRAELAGMTNKLADLQIARQRAQLSAETLASDMAAARAERLAQLNFEIQKLTDEIGDGSADTDGAAGSRALRYYIARVTENGVSTDKATAFAGVLPGDVVIVAQGGSVGDDNKAGGDALTQRVLEYSAKPALSGVTLQPR